jgi:hypothetical protein
MPDYCTIYSTSADFEGVVRVVRDLVPTPVEITGSEGMWTRLVVRAGNDSVTFNALVKGVPQDKFSKTILGTYTVADRFETPDEAVKEKFLNRILSTKLILGVVAEPTLDAFAADCITVVTRELSGFVFNGEDFMDAEANSIWPALSI